MNLYLLQDRNDGRRKLAALLCANHHRRSQRNGGAIRASWGLTNGLYSPGPRIWPAAGLEQRRERSLTWGTDVMHASATVVSQHVSYRIGPVRTFAFEVGPARLTGALPTCC